MQKFVLTTAAALALSTGAALAASPDPTATSVAPAIQGQAAVSAYSGYYSGYVYPNERMAADEQYMARPTAPQAGHGVFSHIYLYPPNEGDDSGNNG
jgi:opacity protein-like surface antigen